MTTPTAGAARLGRATALAVAAYGLSLLAHVVGGGQLPAPWATAGLGLLTLWAAVAVTGRRLGRLATLALLGGSQLALHGAFGVFDSAGTCATVVHQHAGHHVDGAVVVCADPALTAGHAMPMGVSMLVAHAVTALLLALLLARGEQAMWFLCSLVWRRPPARLALPSLPLVRGAAAREVVCRVVPVPGGVGRRGPPAPAPATA